MDCGNTVTNLVEQNKFLWSLLTHRVIHFSCSPHPFQSPPFPPLPLLLPPPPSPIPPPLLVLLSQPPPCCLDQRVSGLRRHFQSLQMGQLLVQGQKRSW